MRNCSVSVIALGGVKGNKRYSNCSSLSFDLSSKDSNIHNIITSPSLQTYEEFIEDLNKRIQENEHFAKALEKYKSPVLDKNLYYDYIESGEVTEQKLQEIFALYSNHGVCSKVSLFSGLHRMDLLANVSFNFIIKINNSFTFHFIKRKGPSSERP